MSWIAVGTNLTNVRRTLVCRRALAELSLGNATTNYKVRPTFARPRAPDHWR